jgi:hypothetical protein
MTQHVLSLRRQQQRGARPTRPSLLLLSLLLPVLLPVPLTPQ